MFYPKIMQPTHARFEQLHDEPERYDALSKHAALTNGGSHIVNGHTAEADAPNAADVHSESIFDKVPAVVKRNFMVTDTIFESPSISGMGIPGPDGDCLDIGPNGLAKVPADVLDELPPECRPAFEAAKHTERDWRGRWGIETRDGARGRLKIGLVGYPV